MGTDTNNPAGAGASQGRGGGDADTVEGRLVESILAHPVISHVSDAPLPDQAPIADLVRALRRLMFPGFFGPRGLTEQSLPPRIHKLTGEIRELTTQQIRASLRYATRTRNDGAACDAEAERITEEFLERLVGVRALLARDVQAAFDGDPAATHTDETIFCYPGVDAVFAYRAARALYELGVPLLPRIIAEQAHSRTGIDIHPGAQIGTSFFIDHGAGVVVGETTVIGDHVRIYQDVTLGAKSFVRGEKRHPTIGDRVTIYAGAVILGGDTKIGDDCIISGGVFLTESVPAGHIVRQKKPELVMRANRGAGD